MVNGRATCLPNHRCGCKRARKRALSNNRISTQSAVSPAKGTLDERIHTVAFRTGSQFGDVSMKRAPGTGLHQAFKRLLDVVFAATGLLVCMPIFAAVALLIICDDGPPVFFRQTRVGRNGRPFRIWKFRTMLRDSRGSVITVAGDDRVTNVGAPLRKYK